VAYSFLTGTSWQQDIRDVCFGVSDKDVTNALLDGDLYAPESEDAIKALILEWNSLKTTFATEFKRATVYHIASKVCIYLKGKLKKTESIGGGDYQYSMQNIDWDSESAKNMNRCMEYLEKIVPGIKEELVFIDIISRTPPMFEEIEINTLET
jgi:hypothetical protein